MESECSLLLKKGLPLCLSPANNFKCALSYLPHQPRFGQSNNILWNAYKSCVQLNTPWNQLSISHHQNTTFRQVYLRYSQAGGILNTQRYIYIYIYIYISRHKNFQKHYASPHFNWRDVYAGHINYGASLSIARWLEPIIRDTPAPWYICLHSPFFRPSVQQQPPKSRSNSKSNVRMDSDQHGVFFCSSLPQPLRDNIYNHTCRILH